MPIRLTPEQVCAVVPAARDVSFLDRGGQKEVFACTLANAPHVLKFIHIGPAQPVQTDDPAVTGDLAATTAARAAREVETMAQCTCDTLVKLGPLGLSAAQVGGENFLYFSEQRVLGLDAKRILKTGGPVPIDQLLGLARDVTNAVKVLWSFAKIHRDIKPGNIMREDSTGRFILLDAGLVLDLNDESLTTTGFVVGTRSYFSPEQMEPAHKRQLDFRSDLFSLGIVLYEMGTGKHPFAPPGSSLPEVLASIASQPAQSPRELRPDLPDEIEAIIMRLLAKRPHLRYRTCDQLIAAIDQASQVSSSGGSGEGTR